MQATHWEFTNRAAIFGCIIGVAFAFYSVDHENAAAILVNCLGPKLRLSENGMARGVLAFAALVLAAGALIRTWASAYLNAGVVYASEVKTASLVADGPYRHTRNPLYFANILMSIAMGFMMSRTGLVVSVAAMMAFCYRLIFREENELHLSQGERYDAYCRAVPRLWPAMQPRVPSTTRAPAWTAGFKAEAWYWGFAAAILAFAITLNLRAFFAVIAASIGLFWISSALLRKK